MTIATILERKGRDVFAVSPDTKLLEIVKLLQEKCIGVVVLTKNDEVCGILSERDIVRALSNNGSDVLSAPASDHMTANVMTCAEGDTVVSVMAKMTGGRFRHMPVVNDGKIAGLVSIGDVVKHRIEQTEKEAADMRAYISST